MRHFEIEQISANGAMSADVSQGSWWQCRMQTSQLPVFFLSSVALTTAGLPQTTSSITAVTPQQGAPFSRYYHKMLRKSAVFPRYYLHPHYREALLLTLSSPAWLHSLCSQSLEKPRQLEGSSYCCTARLLSHLWPCTVSWEQCVPPSLETMAGSVRRSLKYRSHRQSGRIDLMRRFGAPLGIVCTEEFFFYFTNRSSTPTTCKLPSGNWILSLNDWNKPPPL